MSRRVFPVWGVIGIPVGVIVGVVAGAAVDRNKGPILKVLEEVLPEQGVVLEIASGAGRRAWFGIR